jgi:large conductance mechanosensitive channel
MTTLVVIHRRHASAKPTKRSFQMGMMQEFKDFALKGNVMDLAVGVIIGGAFGKIVDSLVKDIIMPIVGKIFGGLNFTEMFVMLSPPAKAVEGAASYDTLTKAGANLFAYGNFITILINFIILAFIIFQMVKAMNALKKAEPAAAPPALAEDVLLLREIRDSLKK